MTGTATRALSFFAGILCLALSVRAEANPVKLKLNCANILVSASYNAGMGACNAVDGNSNTYWNSGGYAPQSITLDLGRSFAIRKIKLQMLQAPNGNSNGTIAVGPANNNMTNVYNWDAPTSDGQWLEFSGDVEPYHGGDVRYIKITTTSSSSWIGWREIEVYGGLEYFGYYDDAGINENHMAETIAAGANVTFVTIQTLPDLLAKLNEAKHRGVKAIVNIGDLVFSWYNADPSTHHLVLNDTHWVPQWDKIKAIVDGGYIDTVASFYLHDEPYLFQISPSDLTKLATQIHADYPTIPTSAIFETDTLRNPSKGQAYVNMTTPNGRSTFDWVGYDNYGDYDPTLSQRLRSYINADQRLIAVPWANRPPLTSVGNHTPTQVYRIDNNINKWHEEIRSDSKYIAVIPFRWQNYENGSESFEGTRAMPWIRQRLYQLAYSFLPLGNAHVFPVRFNATSIYHPDNSPFAAFNLDNGDMWNSGCYSNGYCPGAASTGAPAITADFGKLTRVGGVRLRTMQDIKGRTSHTLYRTSDRVNWIPFKTFNRITSNSQLLSWTGTIDAIAIRVQTTRSPSWVAWRDIQFLQ